MGSCFAKWGCDYAESQIGYTEGYNNWNKFADLLDSINYYEGCGKKQNLPWLKTVLQPRPFRSQF